MFRLIWLTIAGLCLGLMLSGCGGGAAVISTRAVVGAFRAAGFRNLAVISNRQSTLAFERAHPELAKVFGTAKPLDEDMTYSRRRGRLPFLPLLAVRFPSAKLAKRTFDRGYSAAALKAQLAQAAKEKVLPSGFSLDKLMTARVCNVVISSYNAHDDPALTARISRAVTLLRRRC